MHSKLKEVSVLYVNKLCSINIKFVDSIENAFLTKELAKSQHSVLYSIFYIQNMEIYEKIRSNLLRELKDEKK